MKEQRIVKIKLDEIHPNSWNPNRMSKEKYKKLKANLNQFGYLQPIVVAEVNGKRIIVDGEHRWKALKENGITESEAVLLTGYTENELKLLTINLNKLKGEFKPYELAELIAELDSKLDNLNDYIALDQEEIHDLKELLKEPLESVEEMRQNILKVEDDQPVIYRFRVEDEEFIFVIDGKLEKETVKKALKLSKGVDVNHKFYNICAAFVQVMSKTQRNKKKE